MNGRKAKQLRRKAKQALYGWYLSLLDEDQKKELTPDLALQYTPVVEYWNETHQVYNQLKKTNHISYQSHVSEGTLRWFILQEKKKHARRLKPSLTPRISF